MPLYLGNVDLKKHIGVGYAFAGGLMFAASVDKLLMPGIPMGLDESALRVIILLVTSMLFGSLFI